MTQQQELRSIIHTPAETARLTVQRAQQMADNKHRSMPFFIDKMTKYFADLMPGETCGVLAQTSNYKTGSMVIWERALAAHLKSQGRESEVIYHVDVENTVETLGMMEATRYSNHSMADISRGNIRDWGAIIRAADKIAGIEIYRIADKLGGSEDAPEIYLTNIFRAIDYARKGNLLDRPLHPAAIFIDYLQALPLDPEVKRSSKDIEKQRRLQVREDIYRIKRMAKYFECPIIVGIQAKQSLGGHGGPNMQIPGTYDCEESSSIAQRLDRLIGQWMPKTTHTIGQHLVHGSIDFDVDERTLWVKVLKQRGGLPAGQAWRCEIDYEKGTVRAL